MAEHLKNIMILDDESEITNSLKKILEVENFNVVTCSSNAEVTQKIANKKFDLFIADYHLTHGQNSEASIDSFVSSNKLGSTNTKIVLISGAIDKDILTRVKAKVSTIMVKPVDPDILIKNIYRLIR